MSLTPEEEAEGDRLATVYNERPFDVQTNPGGFGRGGNSAIGLFIASLRDMVGFGRGVVRVATGAVAEVTQKLADLRTQAVLIAGGPVSSVTVGGVTQTGAVTIDLAEISEAAEQKLAEVQDALDELTASNASLRANANAYSLAFGG